jgi:hypothetical protein
MQKPEGHLAAKTTHPVAHPQTCFEYLNSIFLQLYLEYNQGVRVRRLATNQKVACSSHAGRTTQIPAKFNTARCASGESAPGTTVCPVGRQNTVGEVSAAHSPILLKGQIHAWVDLGCGTLPLLIVKPATVVRWHRRGFRLNADGILAT